MATYEDEFVHQLERRVKLSAPIIAALRSQDPRVNIKRSRLAHLNDKASEVWMPGGFSGVIFAVFELVRYARPEMGRTARAEAMLLIEQFGGRESKRPNKAIVSYASSLWSPYLRAAAKGKAHLVEKQGVGWLMKHNRAGIGKHGYVKPDGAQAGGGGEDEA